MANPMNMTIFTMMKARLQELGERQKVISENVANVSTPGFTPSDVDETSFSKTLARMAGHAGAGPGRTQMLTSDPGHMTAPRVSSVGVTTMKAPDSETTLDGNSVVVEEQMMKVAETRTEFETMVGLYQKSLGLLRLASRAPGS
ncbi:MAG: flagellar biosynthesis protein FlgB [Alphaproteobacteria bacterium]|nr:flagellar biosynthesis protein FlgB [Alphaproteobacteria bacterium]